jgi:TonB-linked SusC/RagA family outer membrane protein
MIKFKSSSQQNDKSLRRLTALGICLFAFQWNVAAADSPKISINITDGSITDVFKEIEKQSEYKFFFNDSQITTKNKINLNVSNDTVENILNDIFAETTITYTIVNNHVVLTNNVAKSSSSQQKGRTIKGNVIDNNGEALIGVNVIVKGTSKGTVTDMNGNYTLEAVPNSATLEFSYIGYNTQEVKVGASNVINVKLLEDNQTLDEVVVVGYGTQKKVTLTGSVSSVSSKELLKAPMQNVSNLLTGKVAGLTSIQSSGKPGADGTTMYVRGMNAFSGNTPLVLVDGVERSMDYVNPNDIESVSILKDASAAVYGVKGANGVILITTKNGNDGPAKISYDGTFTLARNTAMPEYLNAADYMYWHNKAKEMDGLTPIWTADIQNKVLSNDPNSIYGETDWIDLAFRTGFTQQHNISATGGTEKTKYYTSIGVMDQEGTLKNTSFTRYNVRTNLDIEVAKNLRFTTNLSAYRTDRDWPGVSIGSNQYEFNPVRKLIIMPPVIKPYYNGYPTAWYDGTYNSNGYADLLYSGYIDQTRYAFDSNYKLEYDFSGLTDILKGLKASIFGAYNYYHTADSQYMSYYQLYTLNPSQDEYIGLPGGRSTSGSYNKSSSYQDTWMLRPQVNYSRTFGKNSINAMFLYEATKTVSSTMTGSKKGYYSDDPVDISLGTTYTENPVSGSHSQQAVVSYVGRLNYAWDEKYLFEFAFRRDGSYVFAPENRWGFFPSVSAGWVMSSEPFIKNNLNWLDYMKLRASYGESGNDNVTAYLYNSSYALTTNSYVLGNTALSQFYSSNTYIYRNLTWSTTHSYNLGLEFDVLNRALGADIDVFYQKTTGILEASSGNYPTSLGGYYPNYKNSGAVSNKGIEFTLRHNLQVTKDFNYKVTGTFSFARNKVLKKAVTDNYPNYRAQLGTSMNARYGFIADGLFQSQEEIDNYAAAPSGMLRLGDIKYVDVNGDGMISSLYDYVKIGYGEVPEINFSLNLDLNYRDFYMSMLWQGVTHCDYELSGVWDTGVTASTPYTAVFTSQGNTPYYLVEGSWTPENTNAKYPRLSTVSNGNNAWRSTWWVVNGEYLRLKNLQFGYQIPSSLLKKTPFSRINVYIAGTNVLTFSHFKYVDPESPSVSAGYYPQQATWSLGLNVSF